MKHIIVFGIVLAAGLLCGTGCGAGEARPGFVTLTIRGGKARPGFVTMAIRGGKATGKNVESARIPVIKTALRGDTLEVDIRTELTGKGTLDFDIPEGARKIRLFGCVYDLPPPDHTAFFHAVPMEEIRPSWLEREEVQYALILVALAPDRKKIDVQIRYLGYSGKERWIQWERNFSCVVADDGQIFESLKPGEQVRMGPGTHYYSLRDLTNQNGKLKILLETTGRYYKYLNRKEVVFGTVVLPIPAPSPYTLFFLNMPFKEKYLAENQSEEIFKVKKSVAEFRALAEKLKRLRSGMTPDETAAVLGKPDSYRTLGGKGPNTKLLGFAEYFFLNTEISGSSGRRNLSVTLLFDEAPDGVFRLREVY